jgi:hypothetical protein
MSREQVRLVIVTFDINSNSPGRTGTDLHPNASELATVELAEHGLLTDPQGLGGRLQGQPTGGGIADR